MLLLCDRQEVEQIVFVISVFFSPPFLQATNWNVAELMVFHYFRPSN